MSEVLRGAVRWEAPAFGEPPPGETLSAEEVAAVLEQARSEGHAQGLAEGLKAGQQEIARQVQRLQQLHRAMSNPLDQIDEDIQRRVVTLALTLAEQVLRVEIARDPEILLPLVREAVAQLAPNSEPPSIHLNPDDLTTLRERLGEEAARWELVADARVAAGGCRVHSGYMEIDATLETRLAAVFAQLQDDVDEVLQS